MIDALTGHIKPDYKSNNFSHIPELILSLFGDKNTASVPLLNDRGTPPVYDSVVLLLLDAFGWCFFETFQQTGRLLRQISKRGTVTRLTTQFPSTTATQTATIHTGIPVGGSKVTNWQYYEPDVDDIFFPLLFSTLGDSTKNALKASHYFGESLFPSTTIYQKLKRLGVKSRIFQHRSITPSVFGDVIFKGAEVYPYNTFPEALVNLSAFLKNQTSPTYYFVYTDVIDAVCHKYGPESPQVEAEIASFFAVLDTVFWNQLKGIKGRTLFIETADHGQTAIDPTKTIYLNLNPAFTGISSFLLQNSQNRYLIPGGSSRDMHLYIKPGMVDEARRLLSRGLGDKAVVMSSDELIVKGYFGDQPVIDGFRERVGDLVILPQAGETVWWRDENRPPPKFRGHHGGLSAEEMYIPFLTLEL